MRVLHGRPDWVVGVVLVGVGLARNSVRVVLKSLLFHNLNNISCINFDHQLAYYKFINVYYIPGEPNAFPKRFMSYGEVCLA